MAPSVAAIKAQTNPTGRRAGGFRPTRTANTTRTMRGLPSPHVVQAHLPAAHPIPQYVGTYSVEPPAAVVSEWEASRSFLSISDAPPIADISESPLLASCPEEEKGGILWPFLLPSSQSASGNLWLMLTYGYVLFSAAGLISEGSELLLEILNPGLVGGLLLPTLGALPDSLIVVASGMRGTAEEAQKEVTVGLGVLAGSTVVLLTLAWAASLVAARCDIDEDGRSIDRTLTKGYSLTDTGATTDEQTRLGARIMILSALPYLVVQIPLIDGHPAEGPEAAVIGAGLCFVGFVSYSIYQIASPWLQEKRMAKARRRLLRARVLQQTSQFALNFGGLISSSGMLNNDALERIFKKFDRDSNGRLDLRELEGFLIGVQLESEGQVPTEDDVKLWMDEFDADNTGAVSITEFKDGMSKWIGNLQNRRLETSRGDLEMEFVAAKQSLAVLSMGGSDEQDTDFDEDDKEEEEDLSKGAIARKACIRLAAGTALVATFADPTVGAIGNFSEAIQVDPFLVAFVVTPLASNASEVVSSFLFALKKRSVNTSLCYSQIYGAITMNNTLCLGIFLAIVHIRGLTWDFSAEVTAMVGVIIAMGVLGGSRNTFRLGWVLPVALLYPMSLFGVEFLENSLGWH